MKRVEKKLREYETEKSRLKFYVIPEKLPPKEKPICENELTNDYCVLFARVFLLSFFFYLPASF